jgi:hypothetical protein
LLYVLWKRLTSDYFDKLWILLSGVFGREFMSGNTSFLRCKTTKKLMGRKRVHLSN